MDMSQRMVFLDWKNPSPGTLYMPITEGLLDTLKHAKSRRFCSFGRYFDHSAISKCYVRMAAFSSDGAM